MSGHSKWATTKRKKAVTDSKRSKVFTRLLKEVQVAAKLGGPADGNPRLKTAIAAARAVSVPNDNIDRAVKRGLGQDDGVEYEEIQYEGYGPGGVAIIIKALTDNRVRTASEVRHALSRGGGSLGGVNSVAFQFEEKGVFSIPKGSAAEEVVFEKAIEAGAEDVVDSEDTWDVLSDVKSSDLVRRALEQLCSEVEGGLRFIPLNTVKVGGEDAQLLLKLLDLLDDLDDIQSVIHNSEIEDADLEKFGT